MKTIRTLVAAAVTLALTAGALIAGSGTAQAATKTQTAAVTVSTTKLEKYQSVTVSVTTSPVAAKKTIYIQMKYSGSSTWKTVKKATTNSSGKYSWTTKMTNEKNRYYRVYIPKRSGYTKAYSKSSPKVDVVGATFKVSATATPASIVGSGTVTGAGKATPYKSKSRTVSIQQSFNGGSWKTVATATISSAGNFKGSVKVSSAGEYRFRVYKAKYSDYGSRYSSTMNVTVAPKGPGAPVGGTFTLSTTSGKASAGQQVTVTGPMTGAKAARVQFKDGGAVFDTSKAGLSDVTATQATVTLPAGPAGITGTLQVQFADNTWVNIGTYSYTLGDRGPTTIESALLAKFNDNRATDQLCYDNNPLGSTIREYPAVTTPLVWNDKLGDYALAYAKEVASDVSAYREFIFLMGSGSPNSQHIWGPSRDGLIGPDRSAKAGFATVPGEAWSAVMTDEQNADPTLIYHATNGTGTDNVRMLNKSACSLVMDPNYTKIGIGFVPREGRTDGVIVVELLP